MALAGVVQVGATPTLLDFGQQFGQQQQWEQLKEGVAWTPVYDANVPRFGSGGNDSWASNALQAANGYNYAMPLAGYLGLFSITKYFPLRSVSSITLELNLSTNPASIVFDNLLPAASSFCIFIASHICRNTTTTATATACD